jgi:hypothetical protein
MRPYFVAAGAFILFAGCQHVQLENHTLRQASTLTDLQYRQVLSNVALFTQNADALPFYATAGTGITSIQNTLAARGTFNWDLFSNSGLATLWFFDKASAEVDPSTQAQEQWTTSCVLNPDELALMRCIYQKVVGVRDCECDKKLTDFFGTKKFNYYNEAMHPGWYSVGCRKEVPKEACYVGRYGKVFVWVTPDGVEELTRITLAILDIATIQPTALGQRTDPNAAGIAALFEKAKKIEDVLRKYPGDKPCGAYKKLKEQLDATICELATKLGESKPKSAEAPMGEQAPEEPLFRDRKNLYNPLQQPAIPMIPR